MSEILTKPAPSALFTVWLLICSTLTVMAGATLAPVLPEMAKHYGSLPHADFWVKMVLVIPGAVIAISAFWLGQLADRHSKLALLNTSLALYCLTGVVGYFFPDNLWLILISRGVLGLAVAAIMVSVTTLAAQTIEGSKLQKYMGLQAAFGSFGGVLFLLISGILAEQDWTYPFLIHAFALLPLTLFLFLKGNLGLPQSSFSPAHQTVPNRDWSQPQKRRLLGFASLGFTELFLLYVIPTYFPFYLTEQFDLTGSEIGTSMAVLFLLVAVTSMAYPLLSKRMVYVRIQTLGLASTALGFFLLACINQPVGVISGSVLVAIGLGAIRPNMILWLFSLYRPEQRGRAMGIVTSSYFIGQFACPLLMRPVSTAWGEAGVFGFASIIAAIVSLTLCYGCWKQAAHQGEPQSVF